MTVYKNIFLLLGSNLGDREKNVLLAIKKINEQAGPVTMISSLYKTQPWGVTDQPDFLNQVIAIESSFRPRQLLSKLKSLETELGRKKGPRWSERMIDIDILFFGDDIVNEPDLTIPHPGIPERRFTLMPLCEITPNLVHPLLQKTCLQLLQECRDRLRVELFDS